MPKYPDLSRLLSRPSWQSDEKKIEDEERREKYRKVLEKRRAKSTEEPKDIPNNAENNGNEASENSKK